MERAEQVDRFPLRVSKMQQQAGLRLEDPLANKRGIRLLPPEIAQRRREKFIRDIRD